MKESGRDIRTLWPETCHGRWMRDEFVPGLVSVIVPTYNRAGLVTEAAESVWCQTYRTIQLIVVDDGSTDNTDDVLKDWSDKTLGDAGFELRYVRQANSGVGSARNRGLIESNGEYVQFLDSDDLLLQNKLAEDVAGLSASHRQYVYGLTVQTSRDGREAARLGSPMCGSNPDDAIPAHNWHLSGALYRRSLCVNVGPFCEDLRAYEDWEYAARVKAIGGAGVFRSDLVSWYRVHDGLQMIKLSEGRAQSREQAIGRVVELLSTLAIGSHAAWDLCSRHLIRSAFRHSGAGNHAAARRCLGLASEVGGTRHKLLAQGALIATLCGRVDPLPVLAACTKAARRAYKGGRALG